MFKNTKSFISIIIAAMVGITIGGCLYWFFNTPRISFKTTPSLELSSTSSFIYHPSTDTIEKYLSNGEFQLAYNEALQYEREHPSDLEAKKYLGLTLFQIGKYDESNQIYQQILKQYNLTPQEQSEIYYFIGRNFDYLKDNLNALNYHQEALELNPQNYAAQIAMGQILLREHKYQEAIPHFEEGLKTLPDSDNNPLASYPYYYLAQTYLALNDYSQAKVMIDKAVKLSKNLNSNITGQFIQMVNNLQNQILNKVQP